MRRLAILVMIWPLIFTAPPASAIGPGEALKDAKLEKRAREIGRQLRCLVCQNQSIDDSDAPLARDLRRLVRKRLKVGDSHEQVVAYIHARYGDFVLLRPPVDARTYILWFGPVIILFGALGWILLRSRRRRLAATGSPSLTADEASRADALLNRDRDGE